MLNANETAVFETPAFSASSLIVTFIIPSEASLRIVSWLVDSIQRNYKYTTKNSQVKRFSRYHFLKIYALFVVQLSDVADDWLFS